MEISVIGLECEPMKIDWENTAQYSEGSKEHKEIRRLIFESERTGGELTPEQVQFKEREYRKAVRENELLQERINSIQDIQTYDELKAFHNPYDPAHRHYEIFEAEIKQFKNQWSRIHNSRELDKIREAHRKEDTLLDFIFSLFRETNYYSGQHLKIWNDKIKAYQNENNCTDLELNIAISFCMVSNGISNRNY